MPILGRTQGGYLDSGLAAAVTNLLDARGKGGQPFMMMTFEAAIEARRVWDWTRWQTRSFQHWYDVVRSEGAIALTGLILGSMFAEEERTKAACMPSDETRPLRYWRPLRSGKPDRDSGVDPGANDGSGPDESG